MMVSWASMIKLCPWVSTHTSGNTMTGNTFTGSIRFIEAMRTEQQPNSTPQLEPVKLSADFRLPDPYDNFCYASEDTNGVTHPLTAQEIIEAVSKKVGAFNLTSKDILDAYTTHRLSINQSDVNNIKIILGYHGFKVPAMYWLNFTSCKYSNCVAVNPHRNGKGGFAAAMAPNRVTSSSDIVLFNLPRMHGGETLRYIRRHSNQYFGVFTFESPAYRFNVMPERLDGRMNFSITYSKLSTVPGLHMYKGCRYRRKAQLEPLNYAAAKSKGALAYISHCDSVNYDRLKMVKELSKYFDVDIFGKCGQKDSCRYGNPDCSYERNKNYHFYLCFENSLCQDYISEKFWKNLVDKANMVPVAMGGLTVQEYTDLAPENSFIHVGNFTTIKELGSYLKYLTDHPDVYNSYHRWREAWVYDNRHANKLPSCELCRIANEKPSMPAIKQLSKQYNNARFCYNHKKFPSYSRFVSKTWSLS